MLMRKGLTALFLLLISLSGQVLAQSRTIKGKVTAAEDGTPIIGATILAKGTNVGTVTNADGVYSLNVPDGVTALVVKFIGMKDVEAKINGTQVDVVLSQDVRTLTETVVTANAIRRDKRSLGYAAPTVKSDELTKGQSTSALNGLAGKVAGVNISSTASAPGSSSRIVLRGGSSISGNNQALMVVDGVPIDNTNIMGGGASATLAQDSRSSVDFGNRGNDINPDDIESISILKGPAAAALYGSRASNGALIITTKSGKKGAKQQITFNNATTFSKILKLPDFQNEFGQGYPDPGYPNGYHNDPKENWSWGAPFDGKNQEWGQEINGVRQTKPYSAIKDNVRDFFETGKAMNNNLSLSGSGDKTTYFLSLNALNSDGVMPGNYDKFNKYGIRFNGTAELNNKFSTSVNINYTKINGDMVQGGQGPGSVYSNVLGTPRDIPLSSLKDLNNPYNSYGNTVNPAGNPTYGYYGAYTDNPYWVLKEYRNQQNVDRMNGNFAITYKPTAWLDVVERLGADIYSDRRKFKYPKYRYIPADLTSGEYTLAQNVKTKNGKYEEDNYTLNEITHDLMVTARKDFSKDFKASLMVGNNIRQRQFSVSEVQTNPSGGLVVPGWYNMGNSNGPVQAVNDYNIRRLIGVYADLNLAYKSMLFLGATARNDWSSTLPKGNNSFFYPSVNGSFVFTELMKDSKIAQVLDYGKIRASWAQVGNDAAPYQLNTYYERTSIIGNFGSTLFPFNGIPGLSQANNIGNPNLKPEITTAFEVGTELGFFDNRLTIDFSYYENKSKNQILNIPIPVPTGFSFKSINAGSIQNKGIELGVRGTPIRTSYGLTVELFGTYTRNRSEVKELLPGVNQVVIGGFGGMSIVAAVGKPYGTFYAQTLQTTPDGKVIVDENTGLPLLTTLPQYLGSYNPDYQASLGTNISYKNWSFSALFDTKQGGVFFSKVKDDLAFFGASEESAEGHRIEHPFPNSVIEDPVGSGKYKTNTVNYTMIDYWTDLIPSGQHVIDASYVKLREASLSYRLPKSLLNKGPFGDVSIGIFGNNLFLWTPKSNKYVDPEVNSGGASNEQGLDFTAQPSLRNFGFNLKVSF